MARLFFALWPDRPAREALAAHGKRIAESAGGRAVPTANLHLTLVFLGEVEPSRVASLHRAADEVEADRFGIDLDEIGCFPHAGVAWAGFRDPPPALLGLQAALADRLALQGLDRETRPFAPHLTLVRRIGAPVERQAIRPVAWPARAFSLVESNRHRGGYTTVAEWSLRERES